MVIPNKIENLKDEGAKQILKEDYGDILIPEHEAKRCYVVVQERKEFDSRTGQRLSNPKLSKYDGDVWLHLTRQTQTAHKDFGGDPSTGRNGVNPLTDMSIEVIHDPYLYNESLEKEPKKQEDKDPEKVEKVEYSLDDLEGMDDDAIKSLYEEVAGKKAGRLSSEKQREYLVENAN